MPARLVIDNLKAAISRQDVGDDSGEPKNWLVEVMTVSHGLPDPLLEPVGVEKAEEETSSVWLEAFAVKCEQRSGLIVVQFRLGGT